MYFFLRSAYFCTNKEVIEFSGVSRRPMEQNQLRPDLQRLLEKFNNIKSDYCKSKINLKVKDEIIDLQKTNMESTTKRVETLVQTFENFQKNYRENLLKYQGENYQLSKRIEELENRCRNLQQTNQDLIVEGNSSKDQRVERLEEEVQILEARLAVEEERHREELEKLKAGYEEQISDKSRFIEELNEKIKSFAQQAVAQKSFVHPALFDEINKAKNRSAVKKKPPNTTFKWPSLDVEITKKTLDPTPPTKRRKKLFHADAEKIIDLVKET